MATNQGCKGLVPNDELHHKFLYYYLYSIVDLLNDLGSGTTFKELSATKLKGVPIPVPPLPEQERIAEILDEAFGAITTATASAEKNLANARELFESAFRSILNSIDQTEWQDSTVEGVAKSQKGSIRTGPFGSQLLHREFTDQGIAVLGIDNAVNNHFAWDQRRFITQGKFEELRRFEAFPGDVIITIMGTCGRCAVLPDDLPKAITSKHLCCITPDTRKCLPRYLHRYFLYHPASYEHLSKHAKGAIMAGLNMTIIRGLPISLPPIRQQRAILERFTDIAADIRAFETVVNTRLVCLTELKQSLLHKAFTGELTVCPNAIDRTLSEAGL